MDRTYAYYNFISDVNLQRRASAVSFQRLAEVSLLAFVFILLLYIRMAQRELAENSQQALHESEMQQRDVRAPRGFMLFVCFISNSPRAHTLCVHLKLTQTDVN